MKMIVVGGPPSVGKTSVLLHTIKHLRNDGLKSAVVKLDCLVDSDKERYQDSNIPITVGLSSYICPDHYLASNMDRIVEWGQGQQTDYLFVESAGLCNRCSPHLKDIMAVTVIDMLSGMNTPRKIGPLLKSADIAVLTRGDLISQAEREVFCLRLSSVAPSAMIVEVNGLTGQGTRHLARQCLQTPELKTQSRYQSMQLRFPMPGAVCSFCLGEKRVGEVYAKGNFRLMELT